MADGVAIHGGNGCGWLGDLCDNGFGEDAAMGIGKGNRLRSEQARAGVFGDQGERLFDGGHADHRVSFSLSL
jgi:hypothetical protein